MKFEENTIKNAYSLCDLSNYWLNTPYEIYAALGAKSKGTVGEEIVKEFLKTQYFKVEKRVNTGHDAIVNNIKTEIKFSLASKRNVKYEFTFNHVGVNKNWERIIFCGVNGDLEVKMCWFTNEDVKAIIQESSCFAKQEGPDDFFAMGKNSTALLNHPYAKNMEDW